VHTVCLGRRQHGAQRFLLSLERGQAAPAM